MKKKKQAQTKRISILCHFLSVCLYKHNYEPAHNYYCRLNGAISFIIMIFCIDSALWQVARSPIKRDGRSVYRCCLEHFCVLYSNFRFHCTCISKTKNNCSSQKICLRSQTVWCFVTNSDVDFRTMYSLHRLLPI